ncbi:MAG: transglutaminase-like domain-containing protein [Patescibacteria group bacterium]
MSNEKVSKDLTIVAINALLKKKVLPYIGSLQREKSITAQTVFSEATIEPHIQENIDGLLQVDTEVSSLEELKDFIPEDQRTSGFTVAISMMMNWLKKVETVMKKISYGKGAEKWIWGNESTPRHKLVSAHAPDYKEYSEESGSEFPIWGDFYAIQYYDQIDIEKGRVGVSDKLLQQGFFKIGEISGDVEEVVWQTPYIPRKHSLNLPIIQLANWKMKVPISYLADSNFFNNVTVHPVSLKPPPREGAEIKLKYTRVEPQKIKKTSRDIFQGSVGSFCITSEIMETIQRLRKEKAPGIKYGEEVARLFREKYIYDSSVRARYFQLRTGRTKRVEQILFSKIGHCDDINFTLAAILRNLGFSAGVVHGLSRREGHAKVFMAENDTLSFLDATPKKV